MQLENLARTKSTKLISGLQSICDYICENSHREPEVVWEYALKLLVELTDANAANIRVADKDGEKLLLRASYGVSRRYRKAKESLPVGESIAGRAFENGTLYAIEDLRENGRYKLPEFARKEAGTSLLSAPLLAGEKKLGVLSIYYPEPRDFTIQEREFFSVLANFLATSFNAHYLHHQLQQSYLNITQMLARVLEEKDSYTRGHSQRVGELAVKIAEEYDLPPAEIDLIDKISNLHDIGKIVVDSSILNKADELDLEEWTAIKDHPEVGARILSPITGFTEGLSMINHHHERVDGEGYPEGLAGDEVPFLARIIAVAHAYDAMTTDRPYRKRMSEKEARRELRKNSGKQFDKGVVEVLLKI